MFRAELPRDHVGSNAERLLPIGSLFDVQFRETNRKMGAVQGFVRPRETCSPLVIPAYHNYRTRMANAFRDDAAKCATCLRRLLDSHFIAPIIKVRDANWNSATAQREGNVQMLPKLNVPLTRRTILQMFRPVLFFFTRKYNFTHTMQSTRKHICAFRSIKIKSI